MVRLGHRETDRINGEDVVGLVMENREKRHATVERSVRNWRSLKEDNSICNGWQLEDGYNEVGDDEVEKLQAFVSKTMKVKQVGTLKRENFSLCRTKERVKLLMNEVNGTI